MFAPGATPSPPTSPAARSLRMSPYRLGSTSTSYSSGLLHQLHAHVVDDAVLELDVRKLARPPRRAVARNSPSVCFMMFALWTAVTFLRPLSRAYSKAYSRSARVPDTLIGLIDTPVSSRPAADLASGEGRLM